MKKYALMILSALIFTACASKPDDKEAIQYIQDTVQQMGYYDAANITRVNGWEEGSHYVVEYSYDVVLKDDLDKLVVAKSENYQEQYETMGMDDKAVLKAVLQPKGAGSSLFAGVAAAGLSMTAEGKEVMKIGKQFRQGDFGPVIAEFIKSDDAKDAYMRQSVVFSHLATMLINHKVSPDAKKGDVINSDSWNASYINTEKGWKLKL